MAKIPGIPVELKYGKLDVIERHLRASVQMIAIGCNSFSTHVIVMACQELIVNVAEKRGVLLEWDHKIWIKGEYHQTYKTLAKKAYNYFKHADRDSEATYDGPKLGELSKLNEVQTLLNINGYKTLGGRIDATLSGFAYILMVKYPEYFRMEFLDAHPTLRHQFNSLDGDPETIVWALRLHFFQQNTLPRVPPVA